MNDNRDSRSRWCYCRSTGCTGMDIAPFEAGVSADEDTLSIDRSRPFSSRIAARYTRRASRARPQSDIHYQWHGARHPNRRTG